METSRRRLLEFLSAPAVGSAAAGWERLGAADDEPEFYHQHALVDGVLFAAGYGRPGVVVDAFVER